jgi:hypothetical protein
MGCLPFRSKRNLPTNTVSLPEADNLPDIQGGQGIAQKVNVEVIAFCSRVCIECHDVIHIAHEDPSHCTLCMFNNVTSADSGSSECGELRIKSALLEWHFSPP